MNPIQAINFLYNTVRNMTLSAEDHDNLKNAAIVVIEALQKVPATEAAPIEVAPKSKAKASKES